METLSLTSASKFCAIFSNCYPGGRLIIFTFSVEKLIHTAPSFKSSVGNLKDSPGTPQMTTSLRGKQSFNSHPSFSTTSCLCFLIPSPLVNCYTPDTSMLYTQAPSLASKAANGRPTVSDRLTIVMDLPKSLFPDGKIEL